MGLAYGQLSLVERRRVFRMVDARLPVAEIACLLGRHRSTIYREIRRNRVASRLLAAAGKKNGQGF
jgi:transposase, IS30 family